MSKKVFRAVIALVCIIFVAAAVWLIGWDITGNINPALWGNIQPETPEEESAATAGIHNHALSASSDDEDAGIELYSSVPSVCPSCGNSIYCETNTATCIIDGVAMYRCVDQEECGWGREYPLSKSSLYHKYSWVISTAPTKDTPGVASNTCVHCGDVNGTRAVYALPDDPEKEGYHFIGWYFDEEFTQAYDNSPIYEDTQLYAKFEINVYTVTFDSAGGNEVESITIDWNNPLNTETPTRTGYNFVGWFKSDGTQFTNGEAVTSNMTLTAHWAIKTFTVTFYVDGAVYASVTVEYGSVLSNVADDAGIFAKNIISFYNLNSETPTERASELIILDDVTVLANEPTLAQKIFQSKYLPWEIGGLCALIAVGVIVGVVEKKKRG